MQCNIAAPVAAAPIVRLPSLSAAVPSLPADDESKSVLPNLLPLLNPCNATARDSAWNKGYDLLYGSVLGEGACGYVCAAVDCCRDGDSLLAAKIISKDIGVDGRGSGAYESRLLKLITNLSIENTCKLLETFDDFEETIIISELADGVDLFELMLTQSKDLTSLCYDAETSKISTAASEPTPTGTKQPKSSIAARELTPADLHTIDMGRQALHSTISTLMELHSYGIAHNDIKLENIMLDTKNGNNRVTLIDFGIASVCECSFHKIRRGEPVTPRADMSCTSDILQALCDEDITAALRSFFEFIFRQRKLSLTSYATRLAEANLREDIARFGESIVKASESNNYLDAILLFLES